MEEERPVLSARKARRMAARERLAQLSKKERALRAAYQLVLAAACGVAVGFLGLWITANAYPAIPADELYAFYRQSPLLTWLNVLPSVLLAVLGWFLFSRVWAAVLMSAVPTLATVCSNFFKIQLRSDPVIASDLALIRTAGGFVEKYNVSFTPVMHLAFALCLGMIAFALYLAPRCRLRWYVRAIGAVLCILLCAVLYQQEYDSDSLYESFPMHEQLNAWSVSEKHISRGCVYPFIHSISDAISGPPEGYDSHKARALYESYADADIPEGQKIEVMGIMCEALGDLSSFPLLADNEKVQQVYALLHELQQRSVSGTLLTNIFAGGTVDSEWCALTGYSTYDPFTAPVDTYVRYFSAQGYDTKYQHPGFKWVYDREHINGYLGFDTSFFTEDGFGELVDPVAALFHSDPAVVDYLLDQLDSRTEADAPLFSFTVTYQNHGPYSAEGAGIPDFLGEDHMGLSDASYNILCNYLCGSSETIASMVRLTEELEVRDTPVVLFFFGDHKPWLGDDMSVYRELGVNMALDTMDGFTNYYGTSYVIWANSAAKQVLGKDFTGYGGDFSPCFLMAKVFDECGWEGPGFMQLSRELRAVTPLVSPYSFFLKDGQLTRLLNERDTEIYNDYLGAQFWREKNALLGQ